MAGVSPDGRNAFADAKAALVDAISLHSGDAGTGGANEVAGGGYARQTPTYAAAAGGVASLTAPLTFSGPSEQAVAEIGYWDGATFLGSQANTGDAAFNVDGEFEVDQADVTDE